MSKYEAHVCLTCGAKGYGGWNCQQCGSHQIAMTERDHEHTYCIRLVNDEGVWWKGESHWCDCYTDAISFDDYYEAKRIADEAQARLGVKVKVIRFKAPSLQPART